MSQEALANESIAKEVAERLNRHYPGHAWAVNADVMQGIVRVHNLNLSGEWGFILKMDDLHADSTGKLIVNAGGELLERFNMSRGELSYSELAQKQTDLRGVVIHET